VIAVGTQRLERERASKCIREVATELIAGDVERMHPTAHGGQVCGEHVVEQVNLHDVAADAALKQAWGDGTVEVIAGQLNIIHQGGADRRVDCAEQFPLVQVDASTGEDRNVGSPRAFQLVLQPFGERERECTENVHALLRLHPAGTEVKFFRDFAAVPYVCGIARCYFILARRN